MREAYFDNAATTRLDERVVAAMTPFFREHFGNPSSLHSFGEAPKQAIGEAREKVADLIGARAEEIIFTSSGTEANNFALKGIAYANRQKGRHIIISGIEHFSVFHSARTLEKWGFEVTHLPVDNYGLVNPRDLENAIKPETTLVSIIYANNEIGTIQPISEISKIAKDRGLYFHTDAVAAVGNIPVDVGDLGVDSLSLAANQFYGPKGAGALYVKKGLRINPLIDGGIQEGGKRAGTEDVPAIVGLGKAAELAKEDIESREPRLRELRDYFIGRLLKEIEHSRLTGHPEKRLPGHVSIAIRFIEGESMLMFLNMKGIAASSGSACTSRALKASHVLIAIGLPHEVAHGSLVFSMGAENTKEDVDYVLQELPPIVKRLREMSPLYRNFLESEET
jgi:cysteine desulfurase